MPVRFSWSCKENVVCIYRHLWQIHLTASHRAPCVHTVMQKEQEEGAVSDVPLLLESLVLKEEEEKIL